MVTYPNKIHKFVQERQVIVTNQFDEIANTFESESKYDMKNFPEEVARMLAGAPSKSTTDYL